MGSIGKMYALVGADISEFTRKMDAVATKTKTVGKAFSLYLTAPIVAVGAIAVKTAADFEQSLINAISVTGEKVDEVRPAMEDLARTMGEKTAFSASQAADAMYYMASAGWKADQMGVALEDTLKLAGATQSDLAFTTDTVIASLNMFEMSASQAGEVANIYANAISNSQATLDKLGTSMGYIGPLANSLNFELEDTTAALMALYNKGIDASTAGTSLRQALSKLLKPTDEASIALSDMGLSVEELNPEVTSLEDIVAKLESRSMTATQAVKIFGLRGANAMLNLVSTGKKGLEELREKLDKTRGAQEMYDKQMATFTGQFTILKSKMEEAAISIGQILLPPILKIIGKIQEWADKFNALSEEKKKTIMIIAGVVAAIGPLFLIISKTIVAIGTLKAGIALLGKAMMTNMGGVIALASALYGVYKFSRLLKEKNQEYRDSLIDADEETVKFNKTLKDTSDVFEWTAERTAELDGKMKAAGLSMNLTAEESARLEAAQQRLAEKEKRAKEEAEELEKELSGVKEVIEETSKAIEQTIEEQLAVIEQQMKDNEEAAKAWKERLKELGGMTIPEKEAAMKRLQAELDRLHQMYKDGVLDLGEYLEMTNKVKGELKEVSETVIPTVVAAHRNLMEEATGAASAQTIAQNDANRELIEGVKVATEKGKSVWEDYTDGLRTSWSQAFSDMIQMPSWMRDEIAPVFQAIYDQFADMVGQMVAKWLTGFITKFVSSTKEAASTVVGSVSDVAKSAVNLAAGFSPGGMIATAVGTAVGSFLGNVLGPKGAGERDMQLVRDYTWEAKEHLRNLVNNLDAVKWATWNNEQRLQNIMENNWSIWERFKNLPIVFKTMMDVMAVQMNLQKVIAEKTSVMAGALSNLTKYQHGGFVEQPQLAIVGEVPEFIIPASKMGLVGGGGGGGTVEVHQHFAGMDGEDVYRVMSTKGLEALITMIQNNEGGLTREIKENSEKY